MSEEKEEIERKITQRQGIIAELRPFRDSINQRISELSAEIRDLYQKKASIQTQGKKKGPKKRVGRVPKKTPEQKERQSDIMKKIRQERGASYHSNKEGLPDIPPGVDIDKP